jgi:hypothetical protein
VDHGGYRGGRSHQQSDAQYRGGDQADRDGQGAERRTEEHHTYN